ncbi:MAG: hypothetical protein AB7T07_02585 [Steroidobacteraceae bacterium]
MSTDVVMIHVRFAPNGTVTEISERPNSANPQAWFNYLTGLVGEAYQPLSGGRGIFRVDKTALDGFKSALGAT